MRKFFVSALLVGAAFAAQPASAATVLPACAATDISSTAAPTVTTFSSFTCLGFYAGNLLNNSHQSEQVTALNALQPGFFSGPVSSFDTGAYTKLGSPIGLNGLKTIDFTQLLNGITLIGVHYGSGTGSPSDVAGNKKSDKSDSTAFYRFDAGTNLDKFYLTYGASSDVVLYKTVTPPAVPEPATWALMLAGFGSVGYAMRRRRNVAISFA